MANGPPAQKSKRNAVSGGWGDQADFERALESRKLTSVHYKVRETDGATWGRPNDGQKKTAAPPCKKEGGAERVQAPTPLAALYQQGAGPDARPIPTVGGRAGGAVAGRAESGEATDAPSIY